MSLVTSFRRAFFRTVLATPEGRAHVLSLMVAAEEGDEAGVFDKLIASMDDPKLARVVAAHQADEVRHAELYRACLERNGLAAEDVPDELRVIREIARAAGGTFATGMAERSADAIATREDVMRTYALLLAIEERGVEQFPIIGSEFRRLGDHETADTFDRVAKDEGRHTKTCRTLGRRYAPDDATWERTVEHYGRLEEEAFERVGLAGIKHALSRGFLSRGLLAIARGYVRTLTLSARPA